jgi:hypothetical protein
MSKLTILVILHSIGNAIAMYFESTYLIYTLGVLFGITGFIITNNKK